MGWTGEWLKRTKTLGKACKNNHVAFWINWYHNCHVESQRRLSSLQPCVFPDAKEQVEQANQRLRFVQTMQYKIPTNGGQFLYQLHCFNLYTWLICSYVPSPSLAIVSACLFRSRWTDEHRDAFGWIRCRSSLNSLNPSYFWSVYSWIIISVCCRVNQEQKGF